jgi:iron complex outermembrane receptor protein
MESLKAVKELYKFLILIVLAGTTCSTAHGQNSREWVIEEIMVTAQKRSQSSQDVPISLNVFNEDMLKKMGVNDFGDLTKATPGFSLSGASDAFPSPYIRGIGTNDNGIGTDPSVGIYIDGIYASRKGGAIGDLMDIERVEILKGPQGTLFGRNSIGGAISITTQKPTNELSGKIEVGLGNYNLQTVKGMINLPLLEDHLFARISMAKRKRDGWLINVVDGNRGHAKDRESLRARLVWMPSDNLKLDAVSFWSRWDDTSAYYENLESDPNLPVSELTKDFEDKWAVNGGLDLRGNSSNDQNPPLIPILQRDLRSQSLTVTADLSERLTLTSMSSYREYETRTAGEYDGSEYFVAENRGSIESNETIGQEFRLSGDWSNFNWFLGASAQRERNSLAFNLAAADPIGINLFIPFVEKSFVETGTDSYAIFGDSTWSITDRLNMTFGARYSLDDKSISYKNPTQDEGLILTMGRGYIMPIRSQFVNEAGEIDESRADLNESWSNLSPRLVFDYQAFEDTMFFASITGGYKSGAFNTYPSPVRDPSDPDFLSVFPSATEPVEPEEVINYELGFKSTWIDRRLTFNASVFAFDYTELQVFVITDSVVQLRNAGAASAEGVEFETTFHLTHNWTFAANGLFIEATFDEYQDAERDLSGSEMYFAPNFSGSFSVDYHVPVFDYGEFRTFISYAYKGEHSIDPDYVQSAYSLLSANISFSSFDETWDISIWGNNIADEAFISNYVDQGRAYGFVGAVRNEPRTYGISASYKF